MRRLTYLHIAVLIGLSTVGNSICGQEVSILENPVTPTEEAQQDSAVSSSATQQVTESNTEDAEELPAPPSESAADVKQTADVQLDDELKSILEPSDADFVVPTPAAAGSANPSSATSAADGSPRARVAPPIPRPLGSRSESAKGPTDSPSRGAVGRTQQQSSARSQIPQERPTPLNAAPSRLSQGVQALQAANAARTAARPVLPTTGSPANVLLEPLRPVPVVVVGGRFGRALAIPAPPFPAPPIAPPFVAGRNFAPPFVGGRGLFRRR